jgi:hypothetical protein
MLSNSVWIGDHNLVPLPGMDGTGLLFERFTAWLKHQCGAFCLHHLQRESRISESNGSFS